MAKFGKSREDQLFYKNAKLERINEELVKKINEELIPAINQLNQRVESQQRVMFLMLYELGGSLEVSQEDIDSVEGKILANINSEAKTARFYIEGPEQEGDER